MDQCSDCGTWLPAEAPRPKGAEREPCSACGSTKRIKFGSAHIQAKANVRADAKLIIGWQEVDRLLDKTEYAAALLIAAVNVEFILWENLRRLSPSSPPSERNNHSEWRTWQSIEKNARDSVGLGSLIQTAQFYAANNELTLEPTLDSFAWTLNETRKGIAHERGYFARLTQLEEANWPEPRIRQILDDAKEFCHSNAP